MRQSAGCVVLVISAIALSGCGGGGGSDTPDPTPTPRPTPAPAPAIEAAAGLVRGTINGVLALIAQGGDGGGGSGSRAHARLLRALAVRRAGKVPRVAESGQYAARGECPRGGSLDGTCSERNGSTTVSSSLSNCGLVDTATGNLQISSGRLVVTLAATGICGSGVIPAGVRFSLQTSNFSGTVSDVGGTVIERFTANFNETFEPTGQGCAGTDATETFDGALDDQTDGGAVDVSVFAHGLALKMTSSGTPCARRIDAAGALDVQDHISQGRFSETLNATQLEVVEEGSGKLATLNGELATDCLGTVQVETATALRLPQGTECPTAGLVTVMRSDGTDGRLAFDSTGGVGFDLDGDGTADKQLADCNTAAQCLQ